MSARALAAAVVLLGSVVAAHGLDVDSAPYRKAAAAGALGAVSGRAWEERRTLDAAEQPLAGTAVTLLPRSGVLRARLEEIRARARDSETVYRTSATAIRRAREAYEKDLWNAGAADLVQTTAVDGAVATFTPSDTAPVFWLTPYRATLGPNISDLAGLKMGEPYEFSFVTAEPPDMGPLADLAGRLAPRVHQQTHAGGPQYDYL
ncbi:MAG: Ig-like domain-containing protein, partial [candidate division NC10 bacterium]